MVEKQDEGIIEIEPGRVGKGKPKAEIATKLAIGLAIRDVHEALLENLEAGKKALEAVARKNKAHYTLLKAKERLHALEEEITQN